MNLYDKLRDDIKEKLESEVKVNNPDLYKEIVTDLTANTYYIRLQYWTIAELYFYCCESTELIQLNGASKLFKD